MNISKPNSAPKAPKPLLEAADLQAMNQKLGPKPKVSKIKALVKYLSVSKENRAKFEQECAKSKYPSVRFVAAVISDNPQIRKLLLKDTNQYIKKYTKLVDSRDYLKKLIKANKQEFKNTNWDERDKDDLSMNDLSKQKDQIQDQLAKVEALLEKYL